MSEQQVEAHRFGGGLVVEVVLAADPELEVVAKHRADRSFHGGGVAVDRVFGRGGRGGDVGLVEKVDLDEQELVVRYDDRKVAYDFQELDELTPAYAVTVHKSQGSEYPCVVLPMHTQHYVMLQRNLLYTGLTRGKKLVVIVGTEKAVGLAVRNAEAGRRNTTLRRRLREAFRTA